MYNHNSFINNKSFAKKHQFFPIFTTEFQLILFEVMFYAIIWLIKNQRRRNLSIEKEVKQELIKKFQTHPQDTGSPEVQIAILTERIRNLTEHFKIHKKDIHSKRGFMRIINRRKKLLRYLRETDFERYKKVIKELGLRK